MIDNSSLLKSQGSLYLEFIPKDGLFHKMFYFRLWDFKLVDVTSGAAAGHSYNSKLRRGTACTLGYINQLVIG